MKKILLSVILSCVICVGCVVPTFAKVLDVENLSYDEHVYGEDFWDIYRGTTARNFVTDSSVMCLESDTTQALASYNEVEDIILEKSHIELEETGRVCFVDPIAVFADGSYKNIANMAEWDTSNEDVVSIYNGQLIANEAGEASVTLTYQGITKSISVSVLNTVDPAEIIEAINNADFPQTISLSASDRNQIVSTAKSMVEMTWTPTQDLTGWKGKTFSKGVKVTGMPYSQTPNQKDKSGFLASMSASDFYSVYFNSSNISMPRYGNDCSGFVSFSWGISRKNTQNFLEGILKGTYSTVGNTGYNIRKDSNDEYKIYNYDDVTMKESFVHMSKGDALIQYGHTFLVAANSAGSEVVYVYEQTPQQARYASYTYDELTNGCYVPFTK